MKRLAQPMRIGRVVCLVGVFLIFDSAARASFNSGFVLCSSRGHWS